MLKKYLITSLLICSTSINAAVLPKKHVTSKNVVPITRKIDEKQLTACILVAEAGGEGITGMKAVFEVIKTRMNQKHTSMYRVVTERYAFSCYNAYRNNPQRFINKYKTHKFYNTALWIVNNHKGNSITSGSNYFHEKTVKPDWSKGVKPTKIIGKHLFFCIID